MQKNNCKLKTILKKGLSFSIALALSVAATSLNLAKPAEATKPAVGSARTVYLAGEKADFNTSWSTAPTHYSLDGSSWKEISEPLVLTSDMTTIKVGDAAGGGNTEDYNIKVYDWAKIYTGTSVDYSHGTTTGQHNTIRDAIVDKLSLSIPVSEHANVTTLQTELKKGQLQLTDGTQIDSANYTEYNGKTVQIKLSTSDTPYVLGTLNIARKISKVELVSGPTEEVCYISKEKINLTGLSVKVTYDVGDPETIVWSADNKDDFTFDNDVEHGKEMTKTIKGIRTTYKGTPVADEDSQKFDLYFCTNQTLGATDGIVRVDGLFAEDATLTTVSLSETSQEYKTLKADFGDASNIIFAYDVRVNTEAQLRKSRVTFNVGKNYKGQTVTVKHLKSSEDGKDVTIETFVKVVDEDGLVVVEASSLSPFMIVLGATDADKAAADKTEQNNANNSDSSKNDNATTDSSKNTSTSSSASKSVKTGDDYMIAFYLFGLVALISAAVLTFIKKNRKNFNF